METKFERKVSVDTLIPKLTNVKSIFKMNHAIRINKTVDIYKNCSTVYFLKSNKYLQFDGDIEKLILYVQNEINERLEIILPQELNPEYKTFSTFTPKFYAEDYHFKHNIDKKSEDHLYFLFHSAYVKIGKSKDIEKRVKSLKTSLHGTFKIYVIENKGCLEKIMHHCFSDFRENREWFRYDYRMTDFINKHGKEYIIKNSMKKLYNSPEKPNQHKIRKESIKKEKPNTDRYLKISEKWWKDVIEGKWVHDDNIHKYLFSKTN